MQELINRFALQQPVQVVVGGNRISFDHLPLLAGEQAGNIYAIMDRIYVSRAETCYQMQDALAALEATPTPLVITDMLESFYEDDLTSNEVTLLLLNCLERIKQLSQSAPVLICARQDNSRPNLMDLLESNSDVRFYFEPLEDEHQSRQIIIPGMD